MIDEVKDLEEQLFKSKNDSTEKVDILNSLSWSMRYADYKKALEYGKNALIMSKKNSI